jgi:O-antigen ligase
MNSKVRSGKLSGILERVFVVSALLLFAGAFVTFLGGKTEGTTTSPLLLAAYVAVYGIAFLLLAVRLRRPVYLATREPLLLLLVGIAVISVLWSVAPEVTLRRSFALLGTTLFGVYLAMRFSVSELLRLLAWAVGIAALLSTVVALALPVYGTDDGAWQGIFRQKNVLGRVMGLGGLVFLLLAVSARRYRWFGWVGFGLSVILVVMADSMTSLAVLLILPVLLPVCGALRWNYGLAVPFFIVVFLLSGVAITLLLNNLELVLAAVERDETFTGRSYIWNPVLDKIWERPLLGYGYGAFWQGWEGESAHVLVRINMTQWLSKASSLPDHSHNGFLDLWLDVGLLGLSVFVVGVFLALLRAIQLIRSTKAVEDTWPLMYLAFLLSNAVTYPVGLEENSIWWVLYVATVLSVAVRIDQAKKNRRFGHAIDENERVKDG